ncbi:MAG: SDR family oxidoreductase [Bacteroidales bacterium]|nr:SDR family oxidoreductase [Bacteroidales bacterium]
MIEVKGKNALITGSSRGIGQQTAIGLARLGCNIILHGRKKENCNETLELLKSYQVKTCVVYGDLSDENQVNDLIKQVNDLNIPVEILYNNAAWMVDYHEDIWTQTWDEWMQTMKINVFAMYSLCAAFIPGMIERGFGRVVNLSSGIMDKPQLVPYGASKWAVNKLTDDIASTLENTGVRINYIDPGWIQTDMGGKDAEHQVEDVLPGILAPALIENDGPNGEFFSAVNHDLDPDFLKGIWFTKD